MSIEINISAAGYAGRTVLQDISLLLPSGTFTALIGRNGSGKSTLIGAILSLVKYEGEIKLDGISAAESSPRKRALLVSGILQRPRAPHITVLELVSLGRNPHGSILRPSESDFAAVMGAIERAELSELQSAYLDEISGGELKRAYFAMLLAQGSENIALDEATASMDADYENAFLRLARSLAADDGKTVIAAVHSLDLAVKYADNILLLDKGKVSFFGTTEEALEKKVIERGFGVVRASIDENNFFYVK